MVLNEYLSVRSIQPRTLENIKELYGLLGNPQQSMVCIQIAGTNGKGSTASMLSNILRCAGYRVGLFTSPALSRPNERIVIDGRQIQDELFQQCAEKVADAEQKLGRTFGGFDRMTACALLSYQLYGVDFAVFETGLGGRLDPVTAIDTKLSVLTSISMDHMELLGDTLEKITFEKCGILKRGTPVICHPQLPEAEKVICQQAAELHCPLQIVEQDSIIDHEMSDLGQSFTYKGERLSLSMIGLHQCTNAATAFEAALKLRELGYSITDEAIQQGLMNTSWPGRLEWVHGVLLDGAHNPDAMRTLRAAIQKFYPGKKARVLISIMQDKDVAGIIAELAQFAVSAVTVQITPRALPAEKLAQLLSHHGIASVSANSVAEGLSELCSSPTYLPLVAGSLYLVGEVRELLVKQNLL